MAVRRALEKDGWTIVADPYTISYKKTLLYADLFAERTEAGGTKRAIVVEVKSFGRQATFHDFQQALGQYISYRDLLIAKGKPTQIYLAVSREAFIAVFGRGAVKEIVARERVSLLVVDTDEEVIIQWID